MKNAPPTETPVPAEPPSIPGFRTWPRLYLLVIASLAIYVIFLFFWSRWFS